MAEGESEEPPAQVEVRAHGIAPHEPLAGHGGEDLREARLAIAELGAERGERHASGMAREGIQHAHGPRDRGDAGSAGPGGSGGDHKEETEFRIYHPGRAPSSRGDWSVATNTKPARRVSSRGFSGWLRGSDLNRRPLGYEADSRFADSIGTR